MGLSSALGDKGKIGLLGDWDLRHEEAEYGRALIATRPILDLCEWSDRKPGAWLYRQLWGKDGLELEGAKERAAADLDRKEAQSEEEGLAQEEKTGR